MFQLQRGLWHLLPVSDMLCRFGDLADGNRVPFRNAGFSSRIHLLQRSGSNII